MKQSDSFSEFAARLVVEYVADTGAKLASEIAARIVVICASEMTLQAPADEIA